MSDALPVEIAAPGADTPDSGAFFGMDADTLAHPQPMFKMMRESMPVLAAEGAGIVLSGRAEIDHAFRNPQIFSSNMSAVDLGNVRPLIPLQIDPPEHKQYRKILDPLFAPREMAKLEEPLAERVNGLIDSFIDRGEVDFASEFSIPFPSLAFLTLLGLPLDDLPLFLKLKDGIVRPDHVTGRPFGSDAVKAYQRETADTIYAYFERIIDDRAVERHDDLISRFLDTEVDGRALTRNEILDICFLFLTAGLDTVTATLDCMFAYFVEHPEQRDEIVADPSLIPSAIEELLRWETPVMAVVRVAAEDTELGGCPINHGDQVVVMLGSANTDDTEFEDPDHVRFDRDVNRHIAFGGGIHRCLGSHLARAELRVALREWHRRIPNYDLAPDTKLTFTSAIRSIEHFPMVFTPGGR